MIYTDQLGRNIELKSIPNRIVSLVPSQTEFLYELGLENEIVGQTVFCVHPHKNFKSAYKIGGTKKLHLDKIRDLQPDIIFANKEENDREQIEILAKEFPVWISDIYTLFDALQMMKSIGDICNKQKQANKIVSFVQSAFENLPTHNNPITALYLIWREPFMAAGNNTFIGDMLLKLGIQNVYSDLSVRYPVLESSHLIDLNPSLVLLSSEPFPFNEKHIQEIYHILPNANVLLVDGEMFSWYGSRLLQTPVYFKQLFDEFYKK